MVEEEDNDKNKTNEIECGSEKVKDQIAGAENSEVSPFLSALNTHLFCLVVNPGQLVY